jgi:hypothetical protein
MQLFGKDAVGATAPPQRAQDLEFEQRHLAGGENVAGGVTAGIDHARR